MVFCFCVRVHTDSIPSNLFLDPAVWKKYILARMANRYTRIFDAGGLTKSKILNAWAANVIIMLLC